MDFVSFDGSGDDSQFALVVVFGAVAFRTFEIPCFDNEIIGFDGGRIDGVGKSNFDLILGGFDFGREVGWLVGFADAVEAAGLALIAAPSEHAAAVELSVFWMEAAAHDTGGKLREGEFAHSALAVVADFFVGHYVDFSVAVTEVEELAVEGSPFGIFGNPEEFGGTAIEFISDPAEGIFHGGVRGVSDGGVAVDVAEEFAGAVAVDPVDAVLGVPVAFLVGDDEGAIGVEADAIGSAEAGG